MMIRCDWYPSVMHIWAAIHDHYYRYDGGKTLSIMGCCD